MPMPRVEDADATLAREWWADNALIDVAVAREVLPTRSERSIEADGDCASMITGSEPYHCLAGCGRRRRAPELSGDGD